LLDPKRSRLAVIGNLYGSGMSAMFRNLLYNPQVRHLVTLGSTPRGLTIADELAAFLEHGVEETTVLGVPFLRIRGYARTLQLTEGFDVERLRSTLSFRDLGTLSPAAVLALDEYVAGLPRTPDAELPPRVRASNEVTLPRYRPSEVHAHDVSRRTPLECWDELLARTLRFGRPLKIKETQRLELLNVKVVIHEPRFESEGTLLDRGFEPQELRDYQERMFDPAVKAVGEDEAPPAYTYGNRLLAYFGQDRLALAAGRLQTSPDAHISLWDNDYDLRGDHSNPCLVTLFLRRDGHGLSLTATFRAHNLLDAWVPNTYGLMAILEHVATRAGLTPSTLTIVSHSLSARVAADRFPVAQALVEARVVDDFDLEDPNGSFVVYRTQGQVVAEHWDGDRLLAVHRGNSDKAVREALSRRFAVSLVPHALQLGMRLVAAPERAEAPERTPPPAVYPSDRRAHQVLRRTPAECWDELAARIRRFGRDLRDVKTIITQPPVAGMAAPEVAGLDAALARLRSDPETRDAYIAVAGADGLASLFFRRSEGRLSLAATFRSHAAWLPDALGLSALLQHAARSVGMPAGTLTLISHTLDVEPTGARERKYDDHFDPATRTVELRQDPHGQFTVSTDGDRLVVMHEHAGAPIATYEGASAGTIVREVSRIQGVSLIANALWLGAELERRQPSTSSP
jgi:thymidylate synthase